MAATKSKVGGSVCAVSSCKLYLGKAKREGKSDIKFHRFPKDPIYQKQWVHKCQRKDKFNPNTAYVCSEHFRADDYIRDLKAELLGYTPKVRRLKPDTIPTLNLSTKEVSISIIKRREKMEAKLSKQAHDKIIALALNTSIQSSSNVSVAIPNEEPIQSIDSQLSTNYEYLYNELFKDYEKLETEFNLQKKELLTIKNSDIDYKKINESLRSQIKDLQKKLNDTNALLKNTQKSITKQLKNKTKSIENQIEIFLSSIFSKNQIDLLKKKKKRVHWSKTEFIKAFTLRRISKQAYIFVKNDLKYPLPGLSSLQRWSAKNVSLRDLIIAQTNIPDNINKEPIVLHSFKHNIANNVTESLKDKVTASEKKLPKIINEDKSEIKQDAIEYLAGWIADKYKLRFPELGLNIKQFNCDQNIHGHDYTMPSWLNHLCNGSIIMPSPDFKSKILRIERLFKKLTKNQIPKGPRIITYLTNKIMNRMVMETKYTSVVQSYIKQRLLIRINYFNKIKKIVKKRKTHIQP